MKEPPNPSFPPSLPPSLPPSFTAEFCPTIPLGLFSLFQLKFAIITPPIISGAFTERISYLPYLCFIILFSVFVYCPIVSTYPSLPPSFPPSFIPSKIDNSDGQRRTYLLLALPPSLPPSLFVMFSHSPFPPFPPSLPPSLRFIPPGTQTAS